MANGPHPSRGGAGERAFALLLLLLCAPLIALIALAIRLTAGSPVLYRGTRLGRDKRPFQMLKLRTLRLGAEQVTRGELVSERHNLTIRGGRFLRDTRLDELPQLWNIVRGEMSFVGPRPERPEVLVTKCLGIPGYEQRFAVRPGLIGVSQLFTPHGTPKCYRTLLDNAVIRKEKRGAGRGRIVAFTMLVVVCQVWRRVARTFRLHARSLGRFQEKRRLNRVAPRGAIVQLGQTGLAGSVRLVDMNEEAILVECQNGLGIGPTIDLVLQIPVPGRNRPGRRTARCTGKVSVLRSAHAGMRMVVHYEPCTLRSEYMIHQYFLRDSLAVPRRAWTGPLPAWSRVVPWPPPAPPAPLLAEAQRVHRVYR